MHAVVYVLIISNILFILIPFFDKLICMEEKIRLQKRIAASGICSRRKAELLITANKVKVNNAICNKLGTLVSPLDCVEVDGTILTNEEQVVFLFNKPLGVLSSAKDDRGRKVVTDFFKEYPYRLFPVGRLDYNTSGAILITNDGELANLIMHPSSHLEKTYLAIVNGHFDQEMALKMEKGILLSDGMTAPCKVNIIRNGLESKVEISIHEGRNRQVRRMFDYFGLTVKSLTRISIGFIKLNDLKRGAYRKLTNSEIEMLKNLCLINKKKNIIPKYKEKNCQS